MPLLVKIQRRCQCFPLLLYSGSILLITGAVSAVFVALAAKGEVSGLALIVIWLFSFMGSGHLAFALVNWLAVLLVRPYPLPRLDLSKGIPSELRTLVVIPTLLLNKEDTKQLMTDLEVRFLANRDKHLHFALLTDFGDASTETTPADSLLIKNAQDRIEALNQKYRSTFGDAFFLFHRPRLWNPQQQTWMGYERKRGKLIDLNRFLCSGAKESFSHIVGDVAVLSTVKYVITLDTDTQLARDSARQFIATMAHPLNQAVYDPTQQRVVKGYGILQPRVAPSLTGSSRSRYAQLCSIDAGIDPYTRVSSDMYQDLFGEGSFTGKGIYDVAIFEQVLAGRLPTNRILSHDLLEGCYARSGFLSDVQLYEEYPASYSVDVSRRHRWIRGDWQIARWALSNIPGSDGKLQKNTLSALSRWKILDNLRRSLTATALLCLFFLGWVLSPTPLLWSVAVAGLILVPSLLSSTLSLFRKSADMNLGQHFSTKVRLIPRHCSQALLSLLCLPHEALFSLDAICRTLRRLLISNKNLLEWCPSAGAKHNDDKSLMSYFRSMWGGPVTAIAGIFILANFNPAGPIALFTVAPLLIAWLISPAVMCWVSYPSSPYQENLTVAQLTFLRKLARKTWRFFETFVGPADNWLPPDNYQERPVSRIAHRTSPTNLGLSLLANMSAYDFGIITTGELIERTEKTFHTMGILERYRGHFYNWYDTQSLEPLPPLYVSSVDSGNLAGHLLTLRSGLAEFATNTILSKQLFISLEDVLSIAHDSLLPEIWGETIKGPSQLAQLRQMIAATVQTPPTTLEATRYVLVQLSTATTDTLAAIPMAKADSASEFQWYLDAFYRQCQSALEELTLLCPWVQLPLSQPYLDTFPELNKILTLREIRHLETNLAPKFAVWRNAATDKTDEREKEALQGLVKAGSLHATTRLGSIADLCLQCHLFSQMDYDFLYDAERRLMSIGYNVNEHRPDAGHYDLLASEARLGSFVGIAQGLLPQESWFALGRLLTNFGGEPILLSWSGSMFEYLMPLLVMPAYEHTLLDETCKAAVSTQIAYGKLRGVPWGVSECGYNAFDASLNYQYQAFGVPGLGLKRGLAADLVIAPYASALALLVAPREACQNLQRLASENFEGRFGMHEAIDYTPSRLPRGQTYGVVQSFMAHHQGMSLLSIAHLLLNAPMQKRFASEPLFQATILLLQERVPEVSASYAHTSMHPELTRASAPQETPLRIFENPNTPNPEVQLLSNGSYHVMLTNAGGGYSRWRDMAVTRWSEDHTRDNWGTFCYIKDMAEGEFWSAAYQPLCKTSSRFQAIFSEGRAEFNRRDCGYDTYMEVVVSSEDDIELRRIRITNRSQQRRTIEVTSFAEVVLSKPLADELHPAFSKLFVQTEIVRDQQAILCTRRPRSASEQTPWMLHTMAVHGVPTEEVSYETDRQSFIGRGRSVANPQAMDNQPAGFATDGKIPSTALSGREGSVLDPIVAIRSRITLDAEQSVTIDIGIGIGETREMAVNLINKYRDRHIADRVFEMTWTHGQVLLRQLGASEAEAQLYTRLAGSIIYASSALRASENVLIKNRQGQSGLWGYAISGDLPIVLLKIENPENIDLVRQLLRAHEYWRIKGLTVDLVIWNEDQAGYRQLLHDQIMGLITAGNGANLIDQAGGIFVRAVHRIADEDRILIQTVARVILSDAKGTLAEQIHGIPKKTPALPKLAIAERFTIKQPATAPEARTDLLFYNGLGGFTPDGREYVITTATDSDGAPEHFTPAPWVNVLANPHFGTIISESGPAYTWSENAHEFRLTPWGNDSVNDARGEAFYIRDEERGHFWSPTPAPCPGTTPYVTRHGFGYSAFEHTERGISSELLVYVALDGAIKFSSLKVRNVSGRTRRLSATGYVEWVMGDLPAKYSMHVVTELDANNGAILARNPYNTEFPDRTAFFP